MSNESPEFPDLESEVLVLREVNQKIAQRLELKENEIVTFFMREKYKMI